MKYNSKEFGKKVAELRKSKRLSQKELSIKSGIAQSTLCDFENGKSNLNIEKLSQIALILDTTLDELLYDYLDRYTGDASASYYDEKLKELLPTLNEQQLSLFDDFVDDFLEYQHSKKGQL